MTTTRPALTVVSECVQAVVVVSAIHPSLGPLYWAYTDGSDHNAPDCYSITSSVENALALSKGWREGIMAWHYRDHMAKVMADEEQFEQFHDLDETVDGGWGTATHLHGMLAVLQQRSGQDVEVFAEWLATAVWQDVAIPSRAQDVTASYVIPQLQPEGAWDRLQA